MNEQTKVKLYEKSCFFWFLMILMPYFGIIFMWISKKNFSIKRKLIFSLIFGLYAIIIIIVSVYNSNPGIIQNLGDISTNIPEFEIINNQSYMRDEKECTAYRVVVDDDTTEKEMRNVFNEIISSDTSYLRTVWFYGLESDIENINMFTVGMLEESTLEEKEGKNPKFTEPTLSKNELIEMRNKIEEKSKFKTELEKNIFEVVLRNKGELFSIETIEAEGVDETTVIAGVLCENNEEIVNIVIKEVQEELFNNSTNESILISFADIEKGEQSDVLVIAGIYADGTKDVTIMSSEYNSKRNNWINSQFSIWDGAHTTLEKLIIDNLNDEKSYEHIETNYIDVNSQEIKDNVNEILTSADYQQSVEINDLFITIVFSAKNAFGGTIKNTAYGISRYADNTIELIGIE